MDEFDFDNDVTFSTNINSIKNNINNNNYTNNNINNKSHYIDEILNYNEDSYKPTNFLSDASIFPCESNKCKKYTIGTMNQPINSSLNKNFIKNKKNKKLNKNIKNNKSKNTNLNNKNNENNENNNNIYITLIILFILFNNHELYNYLQYKGISYYKSLIIRLILFLISFYLINKYIIN